MSTLPSKRQFLNSIINPATGQPFASLTRGRFSREAEAVAAAAPHLWQPEAPKAAPAPRAPRPTVVTSTGTRFQPVAVKAQPEVNAKDVRVWAKENGVAVGARGRVRPEVIEAFLKAGGRARGVSAPRAQAASAPVVRTNKTAWALIPRQPGEGPWAKTFVLGASKCSKGHTIQSCTCETMMSPKMGLMPSVPLLLVKPVV